MRIEAQGLVDHLPRAASLTEGLPCPRRIEPCLRIRGTKAQGRVEGGDGLGRPTQVQEETAFLAVGEVLSVRRRADRQLDVREGGRRGGAPAPVFRTKMAMPMATSVPIAQGEETLSVSVSVTWAIKPAQ